MRFETGPVCIVDQTAPKTTPRPTPRDASLIKEVRTQLAPAGAGRVRGAARAARRGDGVRFASKAWWWRRVWGEVLCVRRVGAARGRSSKLGTWLLKELRCRRTPISMASADEKVKSGSSNGSG